MSLSVFLIDDFQTMTLLTYPPKIVFLIIDVSLNQRAWLLKLLILGFASPQLSAPIFAFKITTSLALLISFESPLLKKISLLWELWNDSHSGCFDTCIFHSLVWDPRFPVPSFLFMQRAHRVEIFNPRSSQSQVSAHLTLATVSFHVWYSILQWNPEEYSSLARWSQATEKSRYSSEIDNEFLIRGEWTPCY